jgi:hypothetical protein
MMSLSLKVASSTVGVGIAAMVAVAEALPQPQSIWPNTVAGWVSLWLSFTGVLVGLYSMHRWAQKPIEKSVADIRERLDGKLTEFRTAVDGQINGYGLRLERLEKKANDAESTINGVLQALVESRQDRKYMGESLTRIEHGMEKLRAEQSEVMSRILEVLVQQRHHERHPEGGR